MPSVLYGRAIVNVDVKDCLARHPSQGHRNHDVSVSYFSAIPIFASALRAFREDAGYQRRF